MTMFHAQRVHRDIRSEHGADEHTVVDQDRGRARRTASTARRAFHYDTGLDRETPARSCAVREAAERARRLGATRFWHGRRVSRTKARTLPSFLRDDSGVRAAGLETCATLGMLKPDQAQH